jgi:hypothetical protein
MKTRVLLCLFFPFFIISCASQKPITSLSNPYEIKKVGIISPQNYIQVLSSKSDERVDDEDYSEAVNLNAIQSISSFLGTRNIQYENVIANREEEKVIQKEIESYFNKMDGVDRQNAMRDPRRFNYQANRDIFTSIKVSDKFAKILKENNLRYALSTITVGFTRTKKNEINRQWGNAGKIVLGATMLALTGVGVFYRGIPYRSITYFFIVDAERKSLTMYSKKMEEIDPTVNSSLQWQINWGLGEYWIEK